MFFESGTGKFKRKIDFPNENLNSCRTPRGTKILMVFSQKKMFFVSLDTFTVIHTEILDPNGKEQYEYFFRGSNKLITSNAKGDNEVEYTSYTFNLNDARMCHKTCNGSCDGKNFIPCPLYP